MRPLTTTNAARGGAAGGEHGASGGPVWQPGPHLPGHKHPPSDHPRLGSRAGGARPRGETRAASAAGARGEASLTTTPPEGEGSGLVVGPTTTARSMRAGGST